jgi:hypothetical protein
LLKKVPGGEILYSIARTILEAESFASTGGTGPTAFGSNKKASDIISRAIKNNGIALIQGPPGTGKTTTYMDVIERTIFGIPANEVYLYIAPTNELVYDMFRKVCFYYATKLGSTFGKYLVNEVRVYGSQFDFTGYETLNNQLASGVKIVISTNYQRIFNSDGKIIYHMLVDEASKSPLHVPFQILVNQILKEKQLDGSISIVGDPMQAISLSEYYSGLRRRLLMMSYFIRGKLDIPSYDISDDYQLLLRARKEINDGTYGFLDTTFRIPGPSHKAISQGYYNGELLAHSRFSERIRSEHFDMNALRNLKNESIEFKLVGQTIEDALTTDVGMMIILDDNKHPYRSVEGVLFDESRGEYGLVAAIILAIITKQKTTVVTTYVDQHFQMRMKYFRKYHSLATKYIKDVDNLLSFKTTQSMLGAQSFNSVLVLGKESSGSVGERTIYFQEPELLNVQLSRHLGFLVVVGNLKRLYHSASAMDTTSGTKNYKSLGVTAEVILNQAGYEKKNRNFSKSVSGNECESLEIQS